MHNPTPQQHQAGSSDNNDGTTPSNDHLDTASSSSPTSIELTEDGPSNGGEGKPVGDGSGGGNGGDGTSKEEIQQGFVVRVGWLRRISGAELLQPRALTITCFYNHCCCCPPCHQLQLHHHHCNRNHHHCNHRHLTLVDANFPLQFIVRRLKIGTKIRLGRITDNRFTVRDGVRRLVGDAFFFLLVCFVLFFFAWSVHLNQRLFRYVVRCGPPDTEML